MGKCIKQNAIHIQSKYYELWKGDVYLVRFLWTQLTLLNTLGLNSATVSCEIFYSLSDTDDLRVVAYVMIELHQPRLWFITGGYLVKR